MIKNLINWPVIVIITCVFQRFLAIDQEFTSPIGRSIEHDLGLALAKKPTDSEYSLNETDSSKFSSDDIENNDQIKTKDFNNAIRKHLDNESQKPKCIDENLKTNEKVTRRDQSGQRSQLNEDDGILNEGTPLNFVPRSLGKREADKEDEKEAGSIAYQDGRDLSFDLDRLRRDMLDPDGEIEQDFLIQGRKLRDSNDKNLEKNLDQSLTYKNEDKNNSNIKNKVKGKCEACEEQQMDKLIPDIHPNSNFIQTGEYHEEDDNAKKLQSMVEVVDSIMFNVGTEARREMGLCKQFKLSDAGPLVLPEDDKLHRIINSISSCVRDALKDQMSMGKCIPLTRELHLFLVWLLHSSDNGLACPPFVQVQKSKSSYLFHEDHNTAHLAPLKCCKQPFSENHNFGVLNFNKGRTNQRKQNQPSENEQTNERFKPIPELRKSQYDPSADYHAAGVQHISNSPDNIMQNQFQHQPPNIHLRASRSTLNRNKNSNLFQSQRHTDTEFENDFDELLNFQDDKDSPLNDCSEFERRSRNIQDYSDEEIHPYIDLMEEISDKKISKRELSKRNNGNNKAAIAYNGNKHSNVPKTVNTPRNIIKSSLGNLNKPESPVMNTSIQSAIDGDKKVYSRIKSNKDTKKNQGKLSIEKDKESNEFVIKYTNIETVTGSPTNCPKNAAVRKTETQNKISNMLTWSQSNRNSEKVTFGPSERSGDLKKVQLITLANGNTSLNAMTSDNQSIMVNTNGSLKTKMDYRMLMSNKNLCNKTTNSKQIKSNIDKLLCQSKGCKCAHDNTTFLPTDSYTVRVNLEDLFAGSHSQNELTQKNKPSQIIENGKTIGQTLALSNTINNGYFQKQTGEDYSNYDVSRDLEHFYDDSSKERDDSNLFKDSGKQCISQLLNDIRNTKEKVCDNRQKSITKSGIGDVKLKMDSIREKISSFAKQSAAKLNSVKNIAIIAPKNSNEISATRIKSKTKCSKQKHQNSSDEEYNKASTNYAADNIIYKKVQSKSENNINEETSTGLCNLEVTTKIIKGEEESTSKLTISNVNKIQNSSTFKIQNSNHENKLLQKIFDKLPYLNSPDNCTSNAKSKTKYNDKNVELVLLQKKKEFDSNETSKTNKSLSWKNVLLNLNKRNKAVIKNMILVDDTFPGVQEMIRDMKKEERDLQSKNRNDYSSVVDKIDPANNDLKQSKIPKAKLVNFKQNTINKVSNLLSNSNELSKEYKSKSVKKNPQVIAMIVSNEDELTEFSTVKYPLIITDKSDRIDIKNESEQRNDLKESKLTTNS